MAKARSKRRVARQNQYNVIHVQAKVLLLFIILTLYSLGLAFPDYAAVLGYFERGFWVLGLNFIGYELERLRKLHPTHRKV